MLRSIIVNKATEGDQSDGAIDLRKIESSFRIELTKEFPIKFGDTYPVPVDVEALKAYKTQRVPYLEAPASLFSFSTLSAFRDILQVVTAKWTEEQVNKWNVLVEGVNHAIDDRNQRISAEKSQKERQEKQVIELAREAETQRERIADLKREIERIEGGYERELKRADYVLSSQMPYKTAREDHALSFWWRYRTHLLLAAGLASIFLFLALTLGYYQYERSARLKAEEDLITKVYDTKAPPALRLAYLKELTLNLHRDNFDEIDLHAATLTGFDLAGASFRSAILHNASFAKANLAKADFSFADLSYCDLSDSDLSGANLQGATLIGADLSGAKLEGANIRGANLTKARISIEQFRSAIRDGETIDPTGVPNGIPLR
ncbi:MAG: pentapeptide repeat-containing protein [Candidatus Acidiferrales bacterium]